MIAGTRHSGMADSKTAAQQALSKLIADATRGNVINLYQRRGSYLLVKMMDMIFFSEGMKG